MKNKKRKMNLMLLSFITLLFLVAFMPVTSALDPPTGVTAVADTDEIQLNWTKDVNATNTYIEYNLTSATWALGQGTLLYNDTGTIKNHTGLTSSTTYYYQLWSWNATGFSGTNVSVNETTSSPPPEEPTTTDNLLNNVIPVLVAVVGLLIIIGMAFTDTLTAQSLISVIVIAVIMIIIFGVLSGG
jgi:hypothetical protein